MKFEVWDGFNKMKESYNDRARDGYYLGLGTLAVVVALWAKYGFSWGLPFFLLIGILKVVEVYFDKETFEKYYNDARSFYD